MKNEQEYPHVCSDNYSVCSRRPFLRYEQELGFTLALLLHMITDFVNPIRFSLFLGQIKYSTDARIIIAIVQL